MTDNDPYSFLPPPEGDKLTARPAPKITKVSIPQTAKKAFETPTTQAEFDEFIRSRTEEPTDTSPDDHHIEVPHMVVFGDEESTKAAGLQADTQPVQKGTVTYPENRTSSATFTTPVRGPVSANPLKGFFRVPEAYVTLPTNGQFNQPGELELTPTGQVGIYPMTAKDELMLRTPDALLNGSALEHLIRSCVPAVVNIRALSSPDFDLIMLGIRMVSYGKNLTYSITCPHCKNEEKAIVDISEVLETVQPITARHITLSNGLTLELHPFTFDDTVKQSVVAFEETAMIRSVSTAENIEDAERYLRLSESVERLGTTTRNLYAGVIKSVTLPDRTVITEHAHISEFLEHTSKKDFDQIEKNIGELNRSGFQREVGIKCSNTECGKDITLQVSFDPSNFFVNSF